MTNVTELPWRSNCEHLDRPASEVFRHGDTWECPCGALFVVLNRWEPVDVEEWMWPRGGAAPGSVTHRGNAPGNAPC